jgi:hypothetical protein
MGRPKLTEEERLERQRASYKSYYQRNRDALLEQMRQNRDRYTEDYPAKKHKRNLKRLNELKEQVDTALLPLVDAIIQSPYARILTNSELVVIETMLCLIPKSSVHILTDITA